MKKAIFTIVAKNYIPLATILGDSIRKYHIDIDFFIFVADREDGIVKFSEQKYPIISSENLRIPELESIAFKYNLTEFCTAIKPYAFNYLFEKRYDKVIYFDPDIYVYSKLDTIFNRLSQYSIVLTPHYTTMETNYSGFVKEGMIMHVGIFNLGFVAIRNVGEGRKIIEWWMEKLLNGCYQDKIDGFHTDQKWMDFIPSLTDAYFIDKNLGLNVAIWNAHERKIVVDNNIFYIENRITKNDRSALIFFHFSNFRFIRADKYKDFFPDFLNKYEDFHAVAHPYSNEIVKNSLPQLLPLYEYSFNKFENGLLISHFQRRFFRCLTEQGKRFKNPFDSTSQDTFYSILKENRLLVKNNFSDKKNEENYKDFDKKVKILNKLFRIFKSVLGIDRYALFCKFALRYFRPENQVFLIHSFQDKYIFINENRYI